MAVRKPFLLRVSPALLDELRGWANQEMRSLNAQIEWVLRQALKERGRRPKDEAADQEQRRRKREDD